MGDGNDLSGLPKPGDRLRLAALGCRPGPIHARRLDNGRRCLVRIPTRQRRPVEGELFDLRVSAARRDADGLGLAGSILEIRLDVAALGLEPLALVGVGDDAHEIERIPPGTGDGDGGEAAVHRAIDLWAENQLGTAEELLANLLRHDLRCLAAHSCLGFFAFNAPPDHGGAARAQRHYEVGLGIADLSLPSGFAGTLPWSLAGNRPLLRCLYGRSICLWRRGRLAEARTGLLRLCRLNPDDQLAARLALESIEQRLG